MDISLQTNSSNSSLELRSCHPLGSDFGCLLCVHSGPFQGEINFYFEAYSLQYFINNLEILDISLKGKASLKLDHEDPYIEFEGDGLGHIKIRGLLLQCGPEFQKLEFEFSTDQTCLRPFINELRLLGENNVM